MTRTLATGATLDAATWADFVARLRHDCEGEGVADHSTADALFTVEAKRIVTGFDTNYTDQTLVHCEDQTWRSPQAYWDDADDALRTRLDAASVEYIGVDASSFLALDQSEQWDVLEHLPDHTVTGYAEHWEYVNAHFTKDAAEAFIRRKKHDYPDGMRVYVESQCYAWEFNAIKDAILSGRLVYSEGSAT